VTSTVLLTLLACRADRVADLPVVYDDLGLPDCAATWTEANVCEAIRPWKSGYPDDFAEADWSNVAVRWIGTEAEPYFCTDDAAEAEAWVLARAPAADGESWRLDASDPRWFDVIRKDVAGVATERQRIVRCSFLDALGPTPPGAASIDGYAHYGTVPVEDEQDFYPVFRELLRWRAAAWPVHVILAHGQVETEAMHLGVCTVRCGVCEDGGGGRFRNITGVLERIDVELDPVTGVVDYGVTEEREADCLAAW